MNGDNTMVDSDVIKLKEVYDQFPWDTREDYRVLRQVRPDFDLPSDTEISKVWGSFSNFKKELKGEEGNQNSELLDSSGAMVTTLLEAEEGENKLLSKESAKMLQDCAVEELDDKTKDEVMENGFVDLKDLEFGYIEFPETKGELKEIPYVDIPMLTEEQQIIRTVVNVFCDNLNFKREDYRAKATENPELPSSHKIDKVFGSFGKFKQKLLSEAIPTELHIPVKEESETSEEQQIIDLVLSVWKNNEIFNRSDYRNKRKSNPELNLPSNDKITNLFGSFNKFKDYVSESANGNSWDLSPDQIKSIRESVQQRRIEIFGETREPYDWEIRSRNRRRGGWIGML